MKDKRRVANDVDSCGNSMFYYDRINLSDRKSFEKTFYGKAGPFSPAYIPKELPASRNETGPRRNDDPR